MRKKERRQWCRRRAGNGKEGELTVRNQSIDTMLNVRPFIKLQHFCIFQREQSNIKLLQHACRLK